MKYILILVFFFASISIQAQDCNPLLLMQNYNASGTKYKSSGPSQLGLATIQLRPYGWGDKEIIHKIATLNVLIPANAYNVIAHPFFGIATRCTIGDKFPNYNINTDCWATNSASIEWGSFTINPTIISSSEQNVSVTFDNWSDCDPRYICLVVSYQTP